MDYQLAGRRRRRSRSRTRRTPRRNSLRMRSSHKKRRSKCNRKTKKSSCKRRSKRSRKCSWVRRKSSGKRRHKGYCKRGGGEGAPTLEIWSAAQNEEGQAFANKLQQEAQKAFPGSKAGNLNKFGWITDFKEAQRDTNSIFCKVLAESGQKENSMFSKVTGNFIDVLLHRLDNPPSDCFPKGGKSKETVQTELNKAKEYFIKAKKVLEKIPNNPVLMERLAEEQKNAYPGLFEMSKGSEKHVERITGARQGQDSSNQPPESKKSENSDPIKKFYVDYFMLAYFVKNNTEITTLPNVPKEILQARARDARPTLK